MEDTKPKTYDEIAKDVEKWNSQKGIGKMQKVYVSRTKLGYCKNDGCDKARRHSSAYCGECVSPSE